MEDKTSYIDLEKAPEASNSIRCPNRPHSELHNVFLGPFCVETFKRWQPSPLRLHPELLTHPLLQEISLDYDSGVLASQQLKTYHFASASGDNKSRPYVYGWVEIINKQAVYEMMGRSILRFIAIHISVLLVWSVVMVLLSLPFCDLVLYALRPFRHAHEAMSRTIYHGMLLGYALAMWAAFWRLKDWAVRRWGF